MVVQTQSSEPKFTELNELASENVSLILDIIVNFFY